MDNLNMVFGLIFSIALISVMAVALRADRLSRRTAVFLGVLSLIVTGLILGGVPDPVLQIAQFFGSAANGKMQVLPLVGLLILLTTTLILGRAFCSYACPLGVAQELAFLAPVKKVKIRSAYRSALRWSFFAVFVIIALTTTIYAAFDPLRFFSLGFVLAPTLAFATIMIAALFIYRPWCNMLCPFGALASLTTRWSILKLRRTEKCIDCGKCVKACPTGEPEADGRMGGCYFCGRCLSSCPKSALQLKR